MLGVQQRHLSPYLMVDWQVTFSLATVPSHSQPWEAARPEGDVVEGVGVGEPFSSQEIAKVPVSAAKGTVWKISGSKQGSRRGGRETLGCIDWSWTAQAQVLLHEQELWPKCKAEVSSSKTQGQGCWPEGHTRVRERIS